jgi:hypothetical protein
MFCMIERMALLTLLAAAACTSERRASGFEVRDSAGVRIAESGAPVWTSRDAWQVEASPAADIGATQGDSTAELSDVTGIERLSDGRIVIGNGDTHDLRFYDSTGHFLRRVGGAGAGPGEFRSLGRLFLLPGDTIVVSDVQLRRLTVFDSAGRLVRTSQLAAGTQGNPMVLLTDRTFLARPGFLIQHGQSGVRRDSAWIIRYDLQGALLDTVGRFIAGENFVYSEGKQSLGGPLPYGKDSYYAARKGGFYFGSGDAPEVHAYDAHGRMTAIVRFHRPPAAITDAHIAQLRLPDDSASALWNRVLASLDFPKQFPAYAGMLRDANANLWLKDFGWPPDETAEIWQVFDANSRWLGALDMPARFNLMRVSGDYLLGIARDDLDVEHVRVYRLIKPK